MHVELALACTCLTTDVKHVRVIDHCSVLKCPAIGKAKRGKFAQSHFEDLLAPVLKACVDRVGLKPDLVDDIAVCSHVCVRTRGCSAPTHMMLICAV